MTKDEMAAVLVEAGYKAEVTDGVVYIHQALTKKEVKNVQSILRKAGYKESYGYRRQPSCKSRAKANGLA